MKYKVIRSLGKEQFEKLVNNHIKDGWVPTGGISVIEATVSHEYFQAMLKTK